MGPLTYGTVDKVCSKGSSASELAVGRVDTGVNDENCGTSSSAGIVDVGGGVLVLVGDATKAPCGTGLGSQS